jgi:hypothetical protein
MNLKIEKQLCGLAELSDQEFLLYVWGKCIFNGRDMFGRQLEWQTGWRWN